MTGSAMTPLHGQRSKLCTNSSELISNTGGDESGWLGNGTTARPPQRVDNSESVTHPPSRSAPDSTFQRSKLCTNSADKLCRLELFIAIPSTSLPVGRGGAHPSTRLPVGRGGAHPSKRLPVGRVKKRLFIAHPSTRLPVGRVKTRLFIAHPSTSLPVGRVNTRLPVGRGVACSRVRGGRRWGWTL